MTQDLGGWLLDQVAEDERRDWCTGNWGCDLGCGCGTPERMLAECDAKRRIVEMHAGGEHLCPSSEAIDDGLWSVADQDVMQPCPTLRLLALPLADRFGYREEWRIDTPR